MTSSVLDYYPPGVALQLAAVEYCDLFQGIQRLIVKNMLCVTSISDTLYQNHPLPPIYLNGPFWSC